MRWAAPLVERPNIGESVSSLHLCGAFNSACELFIHRCVPREDLRLISALRLEVAEQDQIAEDHNNREDADGCKSLLLGLRRHFVDDLLVRSGKSFHFVRIHSFVLPKYPRLLCRYLLVDGRMLCGNAILDGVVLDVTEEGGP